MIKTYRRSLAAILILFLCSYGNVCFSQDDNHTSAKKFAVEAGANFFNMNFNKGVPAPPQPVSSSWKAGPSFGLLLQVPLTDKLFLQPGYYYQRRNGADKRTATSYTNDYCAFPLLLKYKVSSLIEIVAGPQAELLIKAGATKNGVKENITHDVEERGVAGVAGINFHVSFFYIASRYVQGLNHIGIGQRSVINEFKYEGAMLSLGYEF